MYDQIGTLNGPDAWAQESRLARDWIDTRFSPDRLATEREAIIARGRAQSTESGGAPA